MMTTLSLQIFKRTCARVARFFAVGSLVFFAMNALGQEPARVPTVPVTIEKLDGTVIEGRWVAVDRDDSLKIETAAAAVVIRFDDIARVSFKTTPGTLATGETTFHLSDGGRVVGTLVGSDGESLVGRTSLGESTKFPFERLAGVEFARREDYPSAAERFASSLADRLAAKDVLITRDVADDVKIVRGRLESIDPVSGKFVLGQAVRSFQTEKIFGIVFAAGPSEHAHFPVTLRLRDGSELSGSVEQAGRDRVMFATSLGFSEEFRLDRLLEMVVHSRRLVYLSDLSIVSETSEGLVHPKWVVGVDRNVAGGPLGIGGKSFRRGLGMHSKGEVSFALDGVYELFVSTIGLDDAVRPRGHVVFRVIGDGRTLFDSGPVSGTDLPRAVRVDVAKVGRLTLVVDYGEGLDLSDYADWGDARVIKPQEGRASR